jgi:hypothetical protein
MRNMFFGKTNPTFLRGYAMSINLCGNWLWSESTVILCWVCFSENWVCFGVL